MAAVPSAVLPAARSLATLRREIDSIDDAIHDLLMQRAEIVGEVVKAKMRDGGADAPLFRPGREAAILRRLIGRNRRPLPAELIGRLWREIIVEFTRLQGPLTVAVAPGAAADAACDHFGPRVLRPVASIAAVLAAVAKGRAQLGVLPLPGARGAAGAWWQRVPADVHILARLPFLRGPGRRGLVETVVVGRQPFEAAGDDVLYKRAVAAKGVRGRVPAALGRTLASARRSGRVVSLIETSASVDDVRACLGESATVEVLGGYARPIVLGTIPSSNLNGRK